MFVCDPLARDAISTDRDATLSPDALVDVSIFMGGREQEGSSGTIMDVLWAP